MLYDGSMSRPKRAIFRLALCVLLLFGQHVAVAHQAAHALDHEPLQSQHAGDYKSFHSNLCAFHADFESLLSAVGSSPAALCQPGMVPEQFSAAPVRQCPSEPLTAASRGPPYASFPRS